jgi:hypothetical protein
MGHHYSIARAQSTNGELNISVRQLPPILNDRQIAAFRKSVYNFASFQTGIGERKNIRIAQSSFIPVASTRHSICKVTRTISQNENVI